MCPDFLRHARDLGLIICIRDLFSSIRDYRKWCRFSVYPTTEEITRNLYTALIGKISIIKLCEEDAPSRGALSWLQNGMTIGPE